MTSLILGSVCFIHNLEKCDLALHNLYRTFCYFCVFFVLDCFYNLCFYVAVHN